MIYEGFGTLQLYAKKPSISVVSVFTFTNELAVLIFIERVLHIYGSKKQNTSSLFSQEEEEEETLIF